VGSKILWDKYPEIREEMLLLEKMMHKCISTKNKLLSDIVKELINAGGKRLRPAFVILSSKYGTFDREKVLSAAAGIELLHTATLVHDDIVDCSQMRRGNATVSEKYNTDMAVYTGDFLFTASITAFSNNVPSDLLGLMAKTMKFICESEVKQYEDKFNTEISVLSYLKKTAGKTAALFSMSCHLGAVLGKCERSVIRNLSRYGYYYGMAFQIRDDILDCISTPSSIGKPVKNDIKEGIVTLPIIYTMKQNQEAKKLVREIFFNSMQKNSDSIIRNNSDKINTLMEMVIESGALELSERLQQKYIEKGISALKALPYNKQTGILADIICDLKPASYVANAN